MVPYHFRERDIRDIDPSYALRTLVAMETLNMSEGSEESIKSLICCPVRNERSEDVIGESLLNGNGHDTLFISTQRSWYHITNSSFSKTQQHGHPCLAH